MLAAMTAVIRSVIVIAAWLCILLPHPGAWPQCGLSVPALSTLGLTLCDHLASAWSMLSFVNGMSEFLEGEVSLVCRKIILIHGQNPGFYYLDLKRFK